MKKQSFLKGSAILLGMVIITKILGLMYKIPLTNLLYINPKTASITTYAVLSAMPAIN